MKNRTSDFLAAALISFLLTAGSLLAPVTAFSLPADWKWVLPVCAGAAALFSFFAVFTKRRISMPILLLIGAGFVFWKGTRLLLSAKFALQALINQYCLAFPTLVPYRVNLEAVSGATLGVCVLGAVLCFLCANAVSRHRALPAILVTLPFMVCSLIILDFGPNVLSAAAYLCGVSLLLLSQLTGKQNPASAGTLTLRLAVPVTALLLVVLAVVPYQNYVRRSWSDKLRPKLNEAVDDLSFFRVNEKTGQVQFVSPINRTLGSSIWNSGLSGFDLNRVGPQRKTGAHVMDVLSDYEATLYLRGISYGVYAGNRWDMIDDAVYEAEEYEPLFSHRPDEYGQDISIRTDRAASIYYLPSAIRAALPEHGVVHYDTYLENPEREKEYTVSISYEAIPVTMQKPSAGVEKFYTQVPEQTRKALEETLLELDSFERGLYGYSDTVLDIVMRTNDYVKQSARYDLNTPACPDGEDFVAWFLLESDTGYCVHFATAMTVLLRCQGVPARLVTGYVAYARPDVWSPVTEDTAHAWVEFYSAGYWMPVDPTPPEALITTDEAAEAQPVEKTHSEISQKPSETEPDQKETDTQNKDNKSQKSNVSKKKTIKIPDYLLIFLIITAIIFVWNILLRMLRKRASEKGSTNRRAVNLYRHIQFLQKLSGLDIPQEITELAMKARFSQHKLTQDELQQIERFMSEKENTMYEKVSLPKKLLYRVFLAIPSEKQKIDPD